MKEEYKRSIVTSIRKETVMTKVTIEGEITKPVEEASQVLREYLMKFYEQKQIPEGNDTKKISAAIDFADGVKMDLVNWVIENTRFL